MKDYISLKKK